MLPRVTLFLTAAFLMSVVIPLVAAAATCSIAWDVPTGDGYNDDGCYISCPNPSWSVWCEGSTYRFETYDWQCSIPIVTCTQCIILTDGTLS